jgi:hypothetical protein
MNRYAPRRRTVFENGIHLSGGFEVTMVKFRQSVVFCVLVFCCKNLFAQTTTPAAPEPPQLPTAPYRLFRTANMWIFIKLDTVTGKMWQIQFDVQGSNRGSVELNSLELADGKEKTPGRFTLYPTSNIYIHFSRPNRRQHMAGSMVY